MNETWIIVLSVIIPLLAFMWALLPWISHVVKSEMSPLNERMARIEGRLESFMEQQKFNIEAYVKLAKIKNPDTDEGVLLTKLNNNTITKDEATQLQQIMNRRRQEAEENNDFLKVIFIIGILALIAYALSRSSS